MSIAIGCAISNPISCRQLTRGRDGVLWHIDYVEGAPRNAPRPPCRDPHIKFANQCETRLSLSGPTPERCTASLRVLDSVKQRASTLTTLASFVVETDALVRSWRRVRRYLLETLKLAEPSYGPTMRTMRPSTTGATGE